jgi:hypothetical protein
MNFFWPSFWRGTRVAVELIDRVAPSHFVSLVVITCSLISGLWKFLKSSLDSGLVSRVTTRTFETFGWLLIKEQLLH